ncbi:MAG TPA: phosphatase [Opitutaceae bacterium]|jgi:exopolyphosphatase/guanosine-5'-triphosphate,3'-diphosphate pyrophosphatase|nr:phosphatase [Opitutaceae bacterium]
MVGVIDIGSNSIKVLVAARGADGRVVAKKLRTIEARISAGISADHPRLGAEGMERGVAAVTELTTDVQAFHADKIIIVATSAVRDAENGAEFCARVKDATHVEVRVLSGAEEADLIGRGLLCDPQLAGERDFYVFDLGGGSLECLAFRDRRVVQEDSLPLGCVRLTEKFVPDAAAPFRPEAAAAIAAHVRAIVAAANFSLAIQAVAIGTGGTLTAVRSVLAARAGQVNEQVPPDISIRQLRDMLEQVGGLPLADRRKVPGLPPGRADVFPAALATLIAVADLGGFEAYRHSLYNLRWGLAAEALS